MNKIKLIYIIILFAGCEQSEIAIEKHPMGEAEINQITMGSDYSQQIYYSMKNNISMTNTKTAWDLAFGSSEGNSQIIINSSTFSQIAKLEDHFFEDPVTVTDLKWGWDNPKGIFNGTAFNNLQNSTTFILDRGYNLNGTSRGYRKVKVDSINSEGYFITYAKLDNTELGNIKIKKDSMFNFQYLSFENNNIVTIEPDKSNWDLVFTQYTHLFIDNVETPAYLVTGVLTNYLNNVLIAKDTIHSFKEITIELIDYYNFSNHQDEIGYNWKTYSFDSQSYTVRTDITYIVKDISNRYFKMHFIDFYNDNGEKGYPKFEIQEL
jgi:hypothetical protein